MTCILVMAMSLLLPLVTKAQSTTDSVFLANSYKVIFGVNQTELSSLERRHLLDKIIPMLRELGPGSVVIGRTAASPEGPYENNMRLANGRRETVKAIFAREGIDADRIRFDMAVEEYPLLLELMRQRHDPDYSFVKSVVEGNAGDDVKTKEILMQARGGRLFQRLTAQYFPELRAVRIMAVIPEDEPLEIEVVEPENVLPGEIIEPEVCDTIIIQIDTTAVVPDRLRRELLSVKSNLAFYGAYIPDYGWAPIPNVSLEYYPRHGHFTWQADFDCPWWAGNTTNHKYFQVRNYTLESRFYIRNSNRSYLPGDSISNGQAAFKGFFLSAYAHACLYGIGWSDRKGFDGPGSIGGHGWQGEGLGAGLGLGYVLPLGRLEHWRLEFSAQFGFFRSQYDPYIYGCPVEEMNDGKYYYKWYRDPEEFKKRQYRFNWLGPTRVGITLSYDLLYRRIARRGASFRHSEKGGER